jgi:hypothetical protein
LSLLPDRSRISTGEMFVLYEHVNLEVEISSNLADLEGFPCRRSGNNDPTSDSKLDAAQEIGRYVNK